VSSGFEACSAWVCGVDCDDMFVDMILVRMVQMAVDFWPGN
jgi:hypothetical protein